MNRWLMPHRTADKLRKLATSLFYEDNWSAAKKRNVFYRVLVDSLSWVYLRLLDAGMEPDEANSELFLLCCDLFKEFDIDKSSIVPYLEVHTGLKAAELLRKITKNKEIPSGLIQIDELSYEIDNEYYLTSPKFLFENKWLAKDLSKAQKNLILKILMTDIPTLRNLANECRLSRETVRTQLQDIAIVFKGRLL